MNQVDVSFHFLHRVEEIEQNILDGRWQSALALALTLPDICGGIAFPDLVKHYRNGRVVLDRQGIPTRDVGSQYIRWFDDHAAPWFRLSPGDAVPYISGERCWQLRCEYLHQNKGFLNREGEEDVRFHLGVNCGTSICHAGLAMPSDSDRDIRIDIEQFCLRMCQAARSYYDQAHGEKDFSLYNTPVLDFVQYSQRGRWAGKTLAVLCGDPVYGRGLQMALETVFDRVRLFDHPEKARTGLGKGGADLWVITGDMAGQPNQPWRAAPSAPVVFLTEGEGQSLPDRPGESRVLPLPVYPAALRAAAEELLEGREQR